MPRVPTGHRKKWRPKANKPKAETYVCVACNNTRRNSRGGLCAPCVNRGLVGK